MSTRETCPHDPFTLAIALALKICFNPRFAIPLAIGLTFAAVHDSFWTHACDVGTMNEVLREQFVRLHEDTDLASLLEQLKDRYACKRGEGESCAGYHRKGVCTLEKGCCRVRWDELSDPPELGELDINVVKESTYFFS